MTIFNFNWAKNWTKEQKLLIFGILGVIIFLGLLIFGIIPGLRPARPAPKTLEFWGVFDSVSDWQPFIQAFNTKSKSIFIHYVQKSPEIYEQDLLDALASGRAPDLVMLHSSWLPRYINKLAFLPQNQMSLRDFQELFPDAASQTLIFGNQIYALPIWFDALTLIYNKDSFNTYGIAEPPRTWDEFVEAVEKLTQKDRSGIIKFSGAALGTAKNVENAADILSVLMLQSGVKMIDFNQRRALFNETLADGYNPGREALRFYTDFANPQKSIYTWNGSFASSRQAFIEGRTAMIFDYALSLRDIKKKAPNLRLGFAPLPQPSDASGALNYASFWAYAVPKNSGHQKEAWQFLSFMIQKDIANSFAQTFGRPASRRDLISQESLDPYLGVFAEEVLSAQSWYQINNSKIKRIFDEMIDSVALFNSDVSQALNQGAQKVTQLMLGQ